MNSMKRLYFVDWLRVLAMLAIFLFHADRFFDFDGWHVKNLEQNVISSIHIAFFSIWIMPLFFVLSGASIYYSLQIRSTGTFVWERIKRLVIPLVLIGYFVTSPPQSYLDRLTNGKFSGSFQEYLPLYFQGMDSFGGNFAWHGFHLWYLLYLFVLSLMLLPFVRLSKKRGLSLLSRLSVYFENPWLWLLLPVPITVVYVLVDVMGMGFIRATGGWSLFAYLFFLAYGYLVFANEKFLEAIKNRWLILGSLAVILSLIQLVVYFGIKPELSERTPWLYLALAVTRVTSSLCWIGTLIGLSEKYLDFNHRFLSSANQAVLPFYILHQVVLLLIGYYILQLQIPVLVKYIVIATLSFGVIMAAYEFLIKRFRPLRFVFGMKFNR
jgi:peptidoglycan/LPS O-acetylase OafA/YrhL